MQGMIYGIGVGPGDPELMTLKAARLLREADVIAIPGKKKETCTAYQIALGAVPEIEEKEIIPVVFPMTKDEVVLKRLIRLSPYEQTVPRNYPPMMITGGLSDPRVTYWEPAKWAARIRAVKTDDNLLLLKINMGAGHGGKSGRFDSLRETAEEFAFILMALDGLAKA